MKKIIMLLICGYQAVVAQPLVPDFSVFAQRREAFMRQMEPNSAAIFPCKPEYSRNGDVDYEYRQESNFYYLSGFEEPESFLLLNPAAPRNKFVLFVQERNLSRETWEGPRAGTEGAVTIFRADTAILSEDFEEALYTLIQPGSKLYYRHSINPKIDQTIDRLTKDSASRKSLTFLEPQPILSEMRLIKNDGDWNMGMKKSIDISADAHIEAMKAIRPGMYECEIQAVFESVYRKNGSPRNGYPCIVGSGPNSTILHYDKNTRKMNDNEVVLMDCAAEYGYYSADITRTVPVNGKFSKEQKDIYRIVLDAQNAAIKLTAPGVPMKALTTTIDSVLGTGLVTLGLLKDKKDFRMFTLHGYSHWIGLEVHDVGSYTKDNASRKLEPGMVFTIEPGIYVRPDVLDKMKQRNYSDEEINAIRPIVERYLNIGVRIEDDIVVTKDSYKNLSERVPREMDEIEKLMAEGNEK